MTLKVNIIKTETGWDYRNASNDNKLIATIREGRNKHGIFIWWTPFANNDGCQFTSGKQAHYEVQCSLNAASYALGCGHIEFNEI